jgi:uncharacterized protein (TIGR03435 family)
VLVPSADDCLNPNPCCQTPNENQVKLSTQCVVLLSAAFLSMGSSFAQLKTGVPAPALHISKLLQAPSYAHVNWTSLRGKTVILEFWATWCGPCVASIPHLNQLAASLDPQKFVFISVDDEDAAVVEAFLKKKTMAGWVVLDDPDGSTFKAYGVSSRPATIIVDKYGMIAGVTTADKLSTESLMSIASERPSVADAKPLPASGQSPAKAEAQPGPAPKDAEEPLFELLIRPVARRENGFGMMHSTDGKRWGYMGVDAKFLLAQAYSIPARRIVFNDTAPTDVYDFWAAKASLDEETFSRMMQSAVPAALNLSVSEKTQEEKVFVLKASPSSSTRLQPATPNEAPYITFKEGKLLIVNSSFDQIAAVLEGHLNIGVLNMTGLKGRYDAEVKVLSGDARSIASGISDAMGIDMVSDSAPVRRLQVSKISKDQ